MTTTHRPIDRMTLQTLTTALDLHRMTLAEARRYLRTYYSADIPGRTVAQFLANLHHATLPGITDACQPVEALPTDTKTLPLF